MIDLSIYDELIQADLTILKIPAQRKGEMNHPCIMTNMVGWQVVGAGDFCVLRRRFLWSGTPAILCTSTILISIYI